MCPLHLHTHMHTEEHLAFSASSYYPPSALTLHAPPSSPSSPPSLTSVYTFPRAIQTDGLVQHKRFVSQFWRSALQGQGADGATLPLKALRILPWPLSWLLVALVLLGLERITSILHPFVVSSCDFTWSSSVCVCVQVLPFYDTGHWIRAHPNDSILT